MDPVNNPVGLGQDNSKELYQPHFGEQQALVGNDQQRQAIIAPPGQQAPAAAHPLAPQEPAAPAPQALPRPEAMSQEMAQYDPKKYKHSPLSFFFNGNSSIGNYVHQTLGLTALGSSVNLVGDIGGAVMNSPKYQQQLNQQANLSAAPYQNLNASMSGRVDTGLSMADRVAQKDDQLDQTGQSYWKQAMPGLLRSGLSVLAPAAGYGLLKSVGAGVRQWNLAQDERSAIAQKALANRSVAPPEQIVRREQAPNIIVRR
jgi:hypothetical protein